MEEPGVAEIPAFARIAYSPTNPRLASGWGSVEVMALHVAGAKTTKRQVGKDNIIVNLYNSSELMWEFCIEYLVILGKRCSDSILLGLIHD